MHNYPILFYRVPTPLFLLEKSSTELQIYPFESTLVNSPSNIEKTTPIYTLCYSPPIPDLSKKFQSPILSPEKPQQFGNVFETDVNYFEFPEMFSESPESFIITAKSVEEDEDMISLLRMATATTIRPFTPPPRRKQLVREAAADEELFEENLRYVLS